MLILLLVSIPVYEIPGITVYGERFYTGSYACTSIDSTDLEFFMDFTDAIEYLGNVDLNSYGTPLMLSNVYSRGGRGPQTAVLINGIPVNDPKTGMFDLSLTGGGVSGIEIMRGGISVPGVSSSMGGVVNILKKPVKVLSFSMGSYGYTSAEIGWGLEGNGFNLNFLRIDGFRSNSSGYSGNVNLFYKGLFITGSLKKTGLPGPEPGKSIPLLGDSTAYSLYDNQMDLFLAGSYVLEPMDGLRLIPFGIYSRMLPYMRYIDFFTGEEKEESDDYRVYTIGITGSVKKSDFCTGFAFRADSVLMFRPDTSWGKLKATFSITPAIEKTHGSLFAGTGGDFTYDRIIGGMWSYFIATGFRKGVEGYVRVSRDFRKPTLNELFWPVYSNPDLNPELSYEVSAGLNNRFFSISGYYRDVKDMIALDATYTPVNVNRAFIKGLEASFVYERERFRLKGSYNYVSGVERVIAIASYDSLFNPITDTFYIPLEYHPENRFSLTFTLRKNPELFIGYHFEGKRVRYVRGQVDWIVYELQPYHRIDAGVVKRFNGFKIKFVITNLLNQRIPLWFGYNPDEYYPGEPRSFRVQVSGRI